MSKEPADNGGDASLPYLGSRRAREDRWIHRRWAPLRRASEPRWS